MKQKQIAKGVYTEAQVRRWRSQMYDNHNREMMEARREAYDKGVRDGRLSQVNELRRALALPLTGTLEPR